MTNSPSRGSDLDWPQSETGRDSAGDANGYGEWVERGSFDKEQRERSHSGGVVQCNIIGRIALKIIHIKKYE
jgi:hypothetical protein